MFCSISGKGTGLPFPFQSEGSLFPSSSFGPEILAPIQGPLKVNGAPVFVALRNLARKEFTFLPFTEKNVIYDHGKMLQS